VTSGTLPQTPATPSATPALPGVVFNWADLAQYKSEKRFLDGDPSDIKTFWAGRDDVHGLLRDVLKSAQHSIVLNMFGYDDDELDAIIRTKLDTEHVYVQMSLDSTQASGVHEKDILARWSNDRMGNSIAIGTSAKHAISHLKLLIVDGVYTVTGSTNWSASGEGLQDNECTIGNNAVRAAAARTVLDINHDFMLKQMAAKAQAARPSP
jgi:phosphatidylserine/phosphatidylglycerophosphate/cardiolipin synthase-like enzyme